MKKMKENKGKYLQLICSVLEHTHYIHTKVTAIFRADSCT